MKSQILAASLLGVVAMIGCNTGSSEPTDGAAATVPAGMTKVVLSVPDMH